MVTAVSGRLRLPSGGRRVKWLLIGLGALLLLGRCYLVEQGFILLTYQFQTEDIDKLLERNELPAGTKEMLATAKEIKQFSESELGLKNDDNFSRFLDIRKDYLVDVVSASEKDRFVPYRWSYPIFGAFPYKGFFNKESALREAQKLHEQDLDVFVRQADAFSTLGFFIDPLYSFMSDYSAYALAVLIIHEQTHATIFLKDQVEFDEELATFIGIEGALLYVKSKFGEDSDRYQDVLRYLDDLDTFIFQIHSLNDTLDALYRRNIDRDEKLAQREQLYSEFREAYLKTYPAMFKTEKFRNLMGSDINNAFILSYMTYTRDLSLYYELYRACGCDVRRLTTFITTLAENGRQEFLADPKKYLAEWLSAQELPVTTICR